MSLSDRWVEETREQCTEVFLFLLGMLGYMNAAGAPSIPTVFTGSDAAGGYLSTSHWKVMSRCWQEEGRADK